MKSEKLIIPKPIAENNIISKSDLIENNSIHPIFKIIDNIYTHEKNNFFSQSKTEEQKEKSPPKLKQISLTPSPNKCHKDQSLRTIEREDVFLNPSALYLSRKPIEFNKQQRALQKERNKSINESIKKQTIKKYNSFDVNLKKLKFPKISPPMIPINILREISSRTDVTQSVKVKEKRCDSISHIVNSCNSIKSIPKPELNKERKIMARYSEKMK